MNYTVSNFVIYLEKDYDEMSKRASSIFLQYLNKKKNGVYGFATGTTPEGLYKELIQEYKLGNISFKNITSFNLDEYFPMDPSSEHSYHHYMMEHLFNHVDMDKNKINVPKGNITDYEKFCHDYDMKIKENGGIHLQILGIGTNGHIGFNEPDDVFSKGTAKIKLAESTIKDNSIHFGNSENIPREAISMGIKSIMMCENILIMASGKRKSDAIYNMIYGNIEPQNPGSVLQLHKNVTVVVDEDAASKIIDKTKRI